MPIMPSDLERYHVRPNAEVVPTPGLVQLTGERSDCLALIQALGLTLYNDFTGGVDQYTLIDRQRTVRGQFQAGTFRAGRHCQLALQTTWMDQASIPGTNDIASAEAKEEGCMAAKPLAPKRR